MVGKVTHEMEPESQGWLSDNMIRRELVRRSRSGWPTGVGQLTPFHRDLSPSAGANKGGPLAGGLGP